MLSEKKQKNIILVLLTCVILASNYAKANERQQTTLGNFGQPGILDLPTGKRLPDGEINLTSHNHEYVLMTGVTFQALPRLESPFDMLVSAAAVILLRKESFGIEVLTPIFQSLMNKNTYQHSLLAFAISLVQAGIPLNTSSEPSPLVILNLQQVLALVGLPAEIHFLIHLVCSLHDLIIVIVTMSEEEEH